MELNRVTTAFIIFFYFVISVNFGENVSANSSASLTSTNSSSSSSTFSSSFSLSPSSPSYYIYVTDETNEDNNQNINKGKISPNVADFLQTYNGSQMLPFNSTNSNNKTNSTESVSSPPSALFLDDQNVFSYLFSCIGSLWPYVRSLVVDIGDPADKRAEHKEPQVLHTIRVISGVHIGNAKKNKNIADLANLFSSMVNSTLVDKSKISTLVIAGNFMDFTSTPPSKSPPSPSAILSDFWSAGSPFGFFNELPNIKSVTDAFKKLAREMQVVWLPGSAEGNLNQKMIEDAWTNLADEGYNIHVVEDEAWEYGGVHFTSGRQMDFFAASDPKNRKPFSYYIDRLSNAQPLPVNQFNVSESSLKFILSGLRRSIPLADVELSKSKYMRLLLKEALRLANGGNDASDETIFVGGHWRGYTDELGKNKFPKGINGDVSVGDVIDQYDNLAAVRMVTNGSLETDSIIYSTANEDFQPYFQRLPDTIDVVVMGQTTGGKMYLCCGGIWVAENGWWRGNEENSNVFVDVGYGYIKPKLLGPVKVTMYQYSNGKMEVIKTPWNRNAAFGRFGVIEWMLITLLVVAVSFLLVGLGFYIVAVYCLCWPRRRGSALERQISEEEKQMSRLLSRRRSGLASFVTQRQKSEEKPMTVGSDSRGGISMEPLDSTRRENVDAYRGATIDVVEGAESSSRSGGRDGNEETFHFAALPYTYSPRTAEETGSSAQSTRRFPSCPDNVLEQVHSDYSYLPQKERDKIALHELDSYQKMRLAQERKRIAQVASQGSNVRSADSATQTL